MAIKIKHKDPKSTDFSPNDIIINVKEGSVFYKTINNELFKIQGDNLDTVDPNEQLLGQATKYNHLHITHFAYQLTNSDDDVLRYIPLNKTTTEAVHEYPYHAIIAPFDGKLEKIHFYCNNNISTSFTLNSYVAESPNISTGTGGEPTLIETQTIATVAENTTHTINFESTTFIKNQVIFLKQKAVGFSGNTYFGGTVVFKLDTST